MRGRITGNQVKLAANFTIRLRRIFQLGQTVRRGSPSFPLWSLTLALLAISLLAASFQKPASSTAIISVNASSRYQMISGWEATAQAGQTECPGFASYASTLFDLAVNDLGINRVRLEIKSGIENPVDYFSQWLNGQITFAQWKPHWYEIVNDNNDPLVINPSGFQFAELDNTIDHVVLPLKQRLEANGEQLYINLNYVDFASSAFEHKDNPLEYAEFVLATYQHLQTKFGWVPNAWEVILEPDTSASWSGTQIGLAAAAAAARLQAASFTPNFILPSPTNMANAVSMFNQAVLISGTVPYVSELSYHRYAGVSDANLQAIANKAGQYGIDTAMLEHIGSGYEDLHKDLSLANNSAWQQYALAYCGAPNTGGKYYRIDTSNPSQPVISMESQTKFLRQYFKFIRSGAVRIGASSDSASFEPLAFINPGSKYVVVVKANAGGPFGVQGLPPGRYGIKYTTGSQYNIDLPDANITSGQAVAASLPAAGVITIYAKAGASATPTPTGTAAPLTKKIYLPLITLRPVAGTRLRDDPNGGHWPN